METYDPHRTPTEIRQGNRRLTNWRVLVTSTVAVAVIFAVIYFVFMASPPPANGSLG